MVMARELSTESLSLRQIAKRLTAAGHRSRKGGPLTHNTVKRWLARGRDEVVRSIDTGDTKSAT